MAARAFCPESATHWTGGWLPPPIDSASLRPRFSVVIPTRGRPDPLPLRARDLSQSGLHDDYEIVVCDNGTTDRTRAVVGEVASQRVRHIRAPRSLAMSDNWELGVSEARGEFILVSPATTTG